MKTKLQILEEQIRKDLPRLLEFREGLILKRKVSHKLYSDYIMIKTIWNDVCTYVEIVEPIHKGNFSDNINNLLEKFEIIGHDILLSDVLKWLQNNINVDIYYSQSEFSISMRYHSEIYVDRKYVKWDLSKPYLKDQSEELIEFLYNLLENKNNEKYISKFS